MRHRRLKAALIALAASAAVSAAASSPASAAPANFGFASADGTRVVFTTDESLVPADTDGGVRDAYQRLGGVTTLLSGALGDGFFNLEAASDDATRIFIETSVGLSAADTDAGVEDVYEISGGTTTLISTDNDPDIDGPFDAELEGVSSDGAKVFVETADPLDPVADTDSGCGAGGTEPCEDIYQRNGNTTTLISGNADGPFNANFSAISSNGDVLFFTTEESLVPADDTDGGLRDVYRRFSGNPDLVSDDADATLPDMDAGMGVDFGGAAEDGSKAWWETSEALDPTADTDGVRQDVYQWDSQDNPDTSLSSGDTDGAHGASFGGASADGLRVFFETTEPLLPAKDTDGARRDVYQRLLGITTFASDDADPTLPDADQADDADFVGTSSNGNNVWFETDEPLDPGVDSDSNVDVYQRLASVTTIASDGSGLDGGYDAEFTGASTNGNFVFFGTEEPLAPLDDTDGEHDDIYHRFGGGAKLVSGDGDGAFDADFDDNSDDGSLAFFSTSETLDPADTDGGERDVYQRGPLVGGTTTVLSIGIPGPAPPGAAAPSPAAPLAIAAAAPGPTGQRAAALKKCKKKKGAKRKKCRKAALKLPV